MAQKGKDIILVFYHPFMERPKALPVLEELGCQQDLYFFYDPVPVRVGGAVPDRVSS